MDYAEKVKYRYEFRFLTCKATIILRQDGLTLAGSGEQKQWEER